MLHSSSPPGYPTPRELDMSDSQRAVELRRFFAPHHEYASTQAEHDYTVGLNSDGALSAYAETVVWRLRGAHAMVSLINKSSQYFLAGARRTEEEANEDVSTDTNWFGCSSVPTPGGLCENTVALDCSKPTEYPCFIVNDLSQDPRFAGLPVVDGSIAKYRFYAGAPITTPLGIKIGSFFIFDDKVRDGLSLQHRKFLHQQAANVMKHLQTKQEAAERRRVALMSKGLAGFLDIASRDKDTSGEAVRVHEAADILFKNQLDTVDGSGAAQDPSAPAKETVLDKIRATLDIAASIIRESLELTAGGVVFLDTTVGYTDNDIIDTIASEYFTGDIGLQSPSLEDETVSLQSSQTGSLRPPLQDVGMGWSLSQGTIRSATDKYKPSKILAMSAAPTALWDHQARILDAKALQAFITSYPKGNVWYFDDEGYYSFEPPQETERGSPSDRRQSSGTTKQRSEAAMLSGVFHKARQIIFLPLWDAGADRWYSGCFVWTQCAVPVFTVESEVAYLSAFTNSMMVEISRLDALTANKVKSDFISSISHEFRSPLHGILASVEFLRDSPLDNTQSEFVSTIQNCGGTLLDTINHVLDYSKINSFEKVKNQQGTISNELFQVTNLALLCEDVVNGMIAANEYRETTHGQVPFTPSIDESRPSQVRRHSIRAPLDIILDIEHRDWEFCVQAGALRRVVMNIFGNAQKYTESGYIMVQLRVRDSQEESPHHQENHVSKTLSLRIRDSGCGMSSEYMERKLYHPFAQEDTFSPGVGLGLSIVWSIVNQLGGKIHIRSELGKGTDVEVTIPVDMIEASEKTSNESAYPTETPREAQECVAAVRKRAVGKSVSITRGTKCGSAQNHLDAMSWDCIQRYCADWFGFELKAEGGDVVITDRHDVYPDTQRILLFSGVPSCPSASKGKKTRLTANISTPIGPFKLARSILALLDMELQPAPRIDAGTQTPLGSPEEQRVMNGIIQTDYGFPALDATLVEPPPNPDTTTEPPITPRLTPPASSTSCTPHTHFPSLTTTTLTLPVRRLPSSHPTPKEKGTDKEEAKKGLRILAVDDNALNLQLLARYLSKRPQDTVVTATNGLEAVSAFKTSLSNHQTIDVVFMDISMPEMDGFEATRLIRKVEPAAE
ncbi:Hybrid signal transduction protein dokA, partial [Lachnellula suecica]